MVLFIQFIFQNALILMGSYIFGFDAKFKYSDYGRKLEIFSSDVIVLAFRICYK